MATMGRPIRPSRSVRGSAAAGHGWTIDASLLKNARNIGEAEAIQRHVVRGDPISWCDQGYAWVDQDAIGWFYVAAFLLIVLPYVIMKINGWTKAPFRRAETRAADHELNPH